MPTAQEISDAIAERLAEARAEIASLQAARSALTDTVRAGGRGRRAAAGVAKRPTARPGRASASQNPGRPARSTAGAAPVQRAATPRSGAASSTPAQPTRARRAAARSEASVAAEVKPARRSGTPAPKRRARDLAAGALEDLLRASENGLSLVALSTRTGVSEAKVRDRLRELERSGQARSSGSRRTSLWRLVSDEERIAQRAAELAKAPRRRRRAAD